VDSQQLGIIDRVRRYAAQHKLWAPEVRVVAAVSGGSDSVAMLFLLRELAAQGELALAGLAHLHHHIRGADADADAAFCRALAARLEISALVGDADVPAAATRDGVSIEVAGREARQRFYAEAMTTAGAARVAVAHTRDDQAETVLLRLTRGAGTAGLAGMAPRRGPVVRPVLDATRVELQQILRDRGETWREDTTNLDRTIPRNRVRHDVLPHLRTINAQADNALARAADRLRVDADFLETLANAAYLQIVSAAPSGSAARSRRSSPDSSRAEAEQLVVTVKAAELTKLPAPLATRVARYALETANPDRSYGLEEAQALCACAAGGAGGDLAGLAMERLGAKVVLRNRGVRRVHKVPSVESFELQLKVPGTVEAPHGAWAVSAEGPMPPPASVDRGAATVVVDARELGAHLIVRPRRPGDRLQPLGAPGRRKVQDVLVDRKVPKDDRDRVPIVTNELGKIVWVAGEVLAEPFRVTALTTTVVVLTLRRT
jgi:tRNA(Ile)-lysidine synthase